MISPHKISVIIPSFNGRTRGYLDDAIRSAINQTLNPHEIILIDDGSSDDTASYVKSTYPNIQVVTQENKGLAGARNTGIHRSTGTWIAFLDDDDIWFPEKLKTQMEFIHEHPELVFLSTHALTIGFKTALQKTGYSYYLEFPYCLAHNPIFAPSSVIIRKDILSSTGPFDETLRTAEDFDLWIRIALNYRLAILPKPLLYYRVHPHQMSNRSVEFENATLQIILRYLPDVNSPKRNVLVVAYLNEWLLGAIRRIDLRRVYQLLKLYSRYGWDTPLFLRRIYDYFVYLCSSRDSSPSYKYTHNKLKGRLSGC